MRSVAFAATTLAAAAIISTAAAASTAGRIVVTAATYGASCRQHEGNVTRFLRKACNGKASCAYRVDVHKLGDPAFGCEKDFSVEWRCGDQPGGRATVPAEAGIGKVVNLSCRQGIASNDRPEGESGAGGIAVYSATYGASCDQPKGNVTSAVRQSCEGRSSCEYRIDVSKLGDPAFGCRKDFSVDWGCPDGSNGSFRVPGEAGIGKRAVLSCPR